MIANACAQATAAVGIASLKYRRACAQHLLQFRSQPAQYVRVFGKRVKTPCKTASGCLVAGQEHRHDLVTHFLLVEWSAGNGIFG